MHEFNFFNHILLILFYISNACHDSILTNYELKMC